MAIGGREGDRSFWLEGYIFALEVDKASLTRLFKNPYQGFTEKAKS